MRDLISYPPLDIIALSEDEEAETDFIYGVKAKNFWPLEARPNLMGIEP
jgi:hypothetical protein